MLARLALLLACIGGGGLASCLTPPALLPGEHIDAELAIGLYPAGTERVEIAAADDVTLRGLFVPADEGAPVVLHLLESSGSAASLKLHYEVLCRQLRDLGIASLLVDYTGVGASDGSRSPRNLAADASAMWDEAVARAGGDPQRVIVRGISIGTIAAALLLERGIEPGAVLLHVPVLADSAVERFARAEHGPFMAWFAHVAYSAIADLDMMETLAHCPAPLLVVAGAKDFFLTDEERAQLAAAVRSEGGSWCEPAGGHAEGTILAHALLDEELAFLVELFPPPRIDEARLQALLDALPPEGAARFVEPAARERLAQLARFARCAEPVLLAAVALANEPGLDVLRYLWLIEERGPLRELPFDEFVDAVALDESGRRLPVDAIATASLLGDIDDRFGGGGMAESVGLIAFRVRSALAGEDGVTSYSIDIGWDRAIFASDARALLANLRAAGFADDALERAALRVLLKAARTPERMRRDADGNEQLEIREGSSWRELDFHAEPPPVSFTLHLPGALGRKAQALVRAHEQPAAARDAL